MLAVLARIILFLSFGAAKGIALVSRVLAPPQKSRARRICVAGTFHNPNWFVSHLSPLTQCGMDEVILVTDGPHSSVSGITYFCPPRLVARVLGRALARLVWVILAGVKFRPDVYIGYHIFPNALIALIAARLFNRRACYQMCGGPVEVVGGGVRCENRVMAHLKWPSRLIERLAFSVVKEFDHVVVRGNSAKAFLRELGMESRVSIIPGSVKVTPRPEETGREYDVVFVGRLVDIKQPLQVIKVMSLIAQKIEHARAAIIGEGPLGEEMEGLAAQLNLDTKILFLGKRGDVEQLLGRARVFILTSKSEGLSIAMMEAMIAGAIPVVANVGDLRDLVSDGENGYLVTPNNLEEYAKRIVRILNDRELFLRLSKAARLSAQAYSGIETVSLAWSACLERMVSSNRDARDHLAERISNPTIEREMGD